MSQVFPATTAQKIHHPPPGASTLPCMVARNFEDKGNVSDDKNGINRSISHEKNQFPRTIFKDLNFHIQGIENGQSKAVT